MEPKEEKKFGGRVVRGRVVLIPFVDSTMMMSSNCWTPTNEITLSTSTEKRLKRQFLMEKGRVGMKGLPHASVVPSVVSTALNTSLSVSGATAILFLIPLKYPSMVFVLSRTKTSGSGHSAVRRSLRSLRARRFC